jgi:hypothetical protein
MHEGVVNNYLLALRQGEYERAYGYLSPTLKGYPRSLAKFQENIQTYSYNFRLNTDTALSIESSEITTITGNNAIVTVRESRFRAGGLFDSDQSTITFNVELGKVLGNWKIVSSSYYFAACWRKSEGCK